MLKFVLIVLFSLAISGYLNYRSRPEISVSRRLLLFALRFISIAIILLLIISPIFYYTLHRSISPKLIVLEDSSASMNLKHGTSPKASALKPAMDKLSQRFQDAGYEVASFRFANGLEGDNSSTLLAQTLAQLIQKQDTKNLSGILIASDGWLRDESLAAVSKLGRPFYVLADSSANPSPDLAVSKVIGNRYAWRNEPNTLRAEFIAENYSGASTAKLYISNRLVSTQTVSLETGKPSSIDFTHRFNQTGFFPWRVELSPLPNESRLSNNSYPGAIEVLAEKQRIILISDKPAWDNKFTLDAITSNPRWNVESYLSRDGRLFARDVPLPKLNTDNLAAIVIVNNGMLKLEPAIVSTLTNLVRSGCGILYQGLPVSELASILPIQRSNILSPYQGFLSPAPAAVNYPMLETIATQNRDIPPVDYYYVTASTGSEVLATISNPQSSPAIVASSASGARILAFATLNLWRWQLQSGEESYKKLITNSLTWLTNKSAGGYSAIYNTSYFRGEEIRIRLRVEDDINQSRLDLSPRIRILDKDKKEVAADYLTRQGEEYSFSTMLSEPGTYSFEISDPDTKKSAKGRFELSESSLEQRDFGYNLPLLAWLASETTGKLLYIQQAESYTPIPAVKEQQVSRREIALYKKWYILSLFIVAFCVELYLRRRWGLL